MFLLDTVMLFMSTGTLRWVGKRTEPLPTHEDNLKASTQRRRRYSTSDEMRYIMYGVGEQFPSYDEQLIDYIRSHISQPSLTRPRKLSHPQAKHRSQVGQSQLVDRLLSGRRNGFFVECGAADGEALSNSLFFELERNWTGLLIDANPNYHRALLDRNRRAYVIHACLSSERRPTTVRMKSAGLLSRIVDKLPGVSVDCFPLNAIMAAINVSHVDYFSLDVEGPELEILRTVDWKTLHIDVMTIEYRIIGRNRRPATLKKLNDLRQFFNDTGVYREVAVLPAGSENVGLDVVFARI